MVRHQAGYEYRNIFLPDLDEGMTVLACSPVSLKAFGEYQKNTNGSFPR